MLNLKWMNEYNKTNGFMDREQTRGYGRMIPVCSQPKPFNITVTQVYAPTSNAEEAELEPFHENLQSLLELTPKKDVLFIIGDWNQK